ncbi:MAG TPA: RodZ domain-containing protein [Burkholderiales bacterium]|nr:RodZ domain-containing protein [Burkholderiales bacterium]
MLAAGPRKQGPGEDSLDTGRADVGGYGREGSAPDTPGAPQERAADWDQTEAAESGEPGPGALLAAERSAQGLGAGDIARQLKLSVRQVEALERDDYGAFAGMVFVRGFLRNYAKLLDLDPEPLVAMTYPTDAAQPGTVSPPVAGELGAGRGARPMRGWLLGALVLIVLVVAAIFEGRQREVPRRALESVPQTAPSAVRQAKSPGATDAAPAARERAPAASADQAPPAAAPRSVPPVTPAATLAPPAATPAPPGATPAPPGATPAPPGATPATTAATLDAAAVSSEAPAALDEKQLRLRFDGASWVEVKDAHGAVIFSQLNDAGSERVVQGRAPLSVVIGNAHSVRLSYGDRPVDLSPHTKVDVARLVLE